MTYDGPIVRQQRAARAKKAAAMAALYLDGWSLQQIGDEYGISRERVRQLLQKDTNVTSAVGGQAVQSARRRARKTAARDARYLAKYGCSYQQHQAIPQKARKAYRMQAGNARTRGIGWEISLWQWWTVWCESGHWENRGRGSGYVMCRRGDCGPYAVSNVYIATARHNSSHKGGIKRDLPLGVSLCRNRYKKYAAKICINGRKIHLGSFPTVAEARAAYLKARPATVRLAASQQAAA